MKRIVTKINIQGYNFFAKSNYSLNVSKNKEISMIQFQFFSSESHFFAGPFLKSKRYTHITRRAAARTRLNYQHHHGTRAAQVCSRQSQSQ